MYEGSHALDSRSVCHGWLAVMPGRMVAATCGHRFIVMADRLLLVPVTLDQFFDADFLDNESAFVFPTVASFVLNALTGCAASMPV